MLRALLIASLTLQAVCACAGPVLDDILNPMCIDQSLQRSGNDVMSITREKPLGQTFVAGDQTQLLCRVAINVAFWHESWQPGESLVLTLWDSPQKQQQLGRFAIPYERRQWHLGVLMFAVESKVEPKRQYYFELTVDGGDGSIHGILLSKVGVPYASGSGFEGGKPMDRNIWFETHVKKPADRDANLAEFFDNFDLDMPALAKVKAAVAAKDWDTACREFLAHMEGRRDIFNDEDATPKLRPPQYDPRESDLVADQKWPAQDGVIIDLGPNWNYFATWPTLGGVGLTRTGLMKPLAWAYSATGDPKYARAWNDMLISMFRNVPNPAKSGAIKPEGKIGPLVPVGISGCLWDSISIAARLHHETFYNRFRKSPFFIEDVRMAWWANMADMANLLERMEAGGNWTTQNTTSLFGLGQKWPEFKKAKKWFAQGLDGIKQNLLENTYPDGALKEATTGYHCFSLGMFFGDLTRAKEMGLGVSPEHMERLESTFNYTMYATQPDWTMPIWGDTNRVCDPTGLLVQGGGYFKRSDMTWVGTKGKEGTKPEKDSIAFTEAGYFIMRSGWDPDARYLVTRNGFSQAHYHHDQLGIILQAYGSDLLPDMGVYNYGTPECNELVRTVSHSTVCVDEKDISPGNGENTWASLPGLDYFGGTAPGYNSLPGIRHHRQILFVKPDYWVVADDVTGDGEHKSAQAWHFAPGKLDFDRSTGAVRTTNTTGGNLAVMPLDMPAAAAQVSEDLYAVGWEKIGKSPVVRYERSGSLPHAFMTVLYPYPAKKRSDVKSEWLAQGDPSVRATRVVAGGLADCVVFSKDTSAKPISGTKLRIAARAALLRTTAKQGNVTAFGWIEGTMMSHNGVSLASAPSTVSALSVRREGDTIHIDTDGPAAGLKVATLGAKRAVVNGKQSPISGGATQITID